MEGIDWQDYVPFFALTLWMWRTLNCPHQSSGGDQGESDWWERCIECNLIRRNTSTMNSTNDRRVVECIIGEEAMREKSRLFVNGALGGCIVILGKTGPV